MRNFIILIIVILILIFTVKLFSLQVMSPSPVSTNTPNFDRSIGDGVITLKYPGEEYGLATNKAQILVHSYIPPCDENFNYCLYYTGDDYDGTNLESAGIRVEKRSDLTSEQSCLNTPPSGFIATFLPASTTSAATHSASVFRDVGGAGAGHYAEGSLYRLYISKNSLCYEFETRIGETQFANYPPGTKIEFSIKNRTDVEATLHDIISSVTLASGEKNLFPNLVNK